MCAVQLIRGVFHLVISFYLQVQGHQVLCCLEYGVGGRGSGDTTMVHVQSLLGAFMDISLRSASLIDEALFMLKSKNLTFELLLKYRIIRILEFSDI